MKKGKIKPLREFTGEEETGLLEALLHGRLVVRHGIVASEPANLYTSGLFSKVTNKTVFKLATNLSAEEYSEPSGEWDALSESMRDEVSSEEIEDYVESLSETTKAPLCQVGSKYKCVIAVIDEYDDSEHFMQVFIPFDMPIFEALGRIFSTGSRLVGYVKKPDEDGNAVYQPIMFDWNASPAVFANLYHQAKYKDGWIRLISWRTEMTGDSHTLTVTSN
ncbi:hypothetical protein BJ508DRAFT_334523 [Ascobolus immersus RN42]|uniref:Uncharacterized protein n=1 Tax=Ascobolus immersus RN42 TaxID=1160509 RepID=A0A3N4HFR5_ASCIM|nr:hypothetical protein BJ508DRAFT_334523 [Ascobolus immersus RN42]